MHRVLRQYQRPVGTGRVRDVARDDTGERWVARSSGHHPRDFRTTRWGIHAVRTVMTNLA